MNHIDQIDSEQLRKFLKWIGPRPLFVQAFPSRYWDIVNAGDFDAAMSAILRLATQDTDAIFFGINSMKAGTKRVPGNHDIARRNLLFLDVDHLDHDLKIPATKEGKDFACEVFERIFTYLLSHGWPAPARIDSGNGHHGYWHIDLPNDQTSDNLVGDFLAALQIKFGPLVDRANKDARRLGRVPGTWNRRGKPEPDRPHRMCMIVDLPERSDLVTDKMIQIIINEIYAEHATNAKNDKNAWTSEGTSDEAIRPGDDLNQRATWPEVLERTDWKIDRTTGSVTYWCRPGKDSGTSATSGYCKNGDLLYVFSSNAQPFEPMKAYSKFHAYTLLKHGGDFSAAAKALHEKGYGKRANGKQETAKPATKKIKVDDHVEVMLTDARKTKSGKITAAIAIMKDDTQVDALTITTASSSRQAATRDIAKHVPNVEKIKIEMLIGALMTQASEQVSKARTLEGEQLGAIVNRVVKMDFAPAYRTPGGFFSESRGQEIRRQDFVTYTPSHLIAAATRAIDISRNDNGDPNRTAILKAVQTELTIMFADWMQMLPMAIDADLPEHSMAAREFRNAVIKTLTAPKTWEQNKEFGVIQRASLISRAAEQIRCAKGVGETRQWKRVLSACHLWWRNVTCGDGEIATLLAARWELFHQIGIQMPSVCDQEGFVALGIRYGVVDQSPPVSDRTDHNTTRIAILRRDFVDPLLVDAEDMVTTRINAST